MRKFEVEGRTTQDTQEALELVQDRFLDYLESNSVFADVVYNLDGRVTEERPALELTVQVVLSGESHRTYLLDALVVPSLGIWPFVPVWGEAEHVRKTTIGGYVGAMVGMIAARGLAGLSARLWGW